MFTTIDEKILANYLTRKIKQNNLTIEIVAQKSNTSESTVRNLCSGKTPNPGILTSLPIIYAVGGSPEEMMFGEDKDAVKEFSINSIKEMYEQLLSEMAKMNETHINNIRAHYEQHREDSIKNYEMRLADKREIIKEKDNQIKFLKIVACIGFGILIGLLILEVSNPSLGWLRF